MMLLFSMLLACHGVDLMGAMSPSSGPYMEGMWEARALTLQAGLAEAEALHAQGDRDAAQQMVRDVYQGSFEPELEVLVREQGSRASAAELEYSFGQFLFGPRLLTLVEYTMFFHCHVLPY